MIEEDRESVLFSIEISHASGQDHAVMRDHLPELEDLSFFLLDEKYS